jgi:serine/threonine-protein kinase
MGQPEDSASAATPEPAPAPSPDAILGAILADKYRVDRILGKGGMGYVVAATHLHLDEPVAIKFLHSTVAQDPELVGRFLREAKAALKIRSEHVVRVLDVGTLAAGSPYMVMEYLAGSDLDAVVKRGGPQPVTTTVDYILQACEALAEAHVQGMVHRDLKPANLFVARRADGSPLVKVLDFGISKVTGAGGVDLGMTKTAVVLGSPLYMSPEQMRSLRHVDARTDIWALGAIMHEMLRGAPAFNASTLPELCAMIIQDTPPSLTAARPDVPPALEAVVLRCMEKDPARRFQDVAEMALALADFASPSGRASVARIRGVLEAAGIVVAPRTASSPPGSAAVTAVMAPPAPSVGVTGGASTQTSWGQTRGQTGGAPPRGVTVAVLVGVGLFVLAGLVVAAISLVGKLRPHVDPEQSAAVHAAASESVPRLPEAASAAPSDSSEPTSTPAPAPPPSAAIVVAQPVVSVPAPHIAVPRPNLGPGPGPSPKPATATGPAKPGAASGGLFDGRK